MEESQSQMQSQPKKRKNHKNNKNNKSNKKVQKRARKRKRKNDNTNNALREASLSSMLSDSDEIFISHSRGKIVKNVPSNNEAFDTIDLMSHENNENEMNKRDKMSLSNVIRDTKYDKKMPLTVKAREKDKNNERHSSDCDSIKLGFYVIIFAARTICFDVFFYIQR